jgi:hypothetical protein
MSRQIVQSVNWVATRSKKTVSQDPTKKALLDARNGKHCWKRVKHATEDVVARKRTGCELPEQLRMTCDASFRLRRRVVVGYELDLRKRPPARKLKVPRQVQEARRRDGRVLQATPALWARSLAS